MPTEQALPLLPAVTETRLKAAESKSDVAPNPEEASLSPVDTEVTTTEAAKVEPAAPELQHVPSPRETAHKLVYKKRGPHGEPGHGALQHKARLTQPEIPKLQDSEVSTEPQVSDSDKAKAEQAMADEAMFDELKANYPTFDTLLNKFGMFKDPKTYDATEYQRGVALDEMKRVYQEYKNYLNEQERQRLVLKSVGAIDEQPTQKKIKEKTPDDLALEAQKRIEDKTEYYKKLIDPQLLPGDFPSDEKKIDNLILTQLQDTLAELKKQSYYEVVGSSKDASDLSEKVKAAKRKKFGNKYHSDMMHNISSESVAAANDIWIYASEIFDTLSDPEKKAEYDQQLMNPAPTEKEQRQTAAEAIKARVLELTKNQGDLIRHATDAEELIGFVNELASSGYIITLRGERFDRARLGSLVAELRSIIKERVDGKKVAARIESLPDALDAMLIKSLLKQFVAEIASKQALEKHQRETATKEEKEDQEILSNLDKPSLKLSDIQFWLSRLKDRPIAQGLDFNISNVLHNLNLISNIPTLKRLDVRTFNSFCELLETIPQWKNLDLKVLQEYEWQINHDHFSIPEPIRNRYNEYKASLKKN